MMQTKITCWKRLFSFVLAVIMLLALLPTSAFAVPKPDATVYNLHKIEESGGTLTRELDSSTTLTPKQNFTYNTVNKVKNLWVYSSSMTDTEQTDGGVIPYVDDKDKNRWYLKEITWANNNSFNGATEKIILMTSKQVAAATSVSDYDVDLSKFQIGEPDDKNRYFIWYVWTQTPPDSSGDEKSYTINYNLNLPINEDIDSITFIDEDGIEPQEGAGYTNVEKAVAQLACSVKEDTNFRVADGLGQALVANRLKGFLAFNISDPNTKSYYFAGWKDKDGNLYDIDKIVTATEDLADENNVIQFTGVWEEIAPYSAAELANIEMQVPLDVFTSGTNGNLLISQSTDTLDKENNTISYTVSAGINGDLLAKDDGVAFKGSDFATFEIIVNVDPNLEFANLNENGTVTLNMASNLVIPKTIEITGGPVNWTGSEGNWTVTVDAAALLNQIVINAAFTDENYKNFADKMTLTGLDFKLKDGAFDVDGVAPEVKTSANMTAKIDLRKIAGPNGIYNTRFRYFVLRNLLMNNKEWSTYFDDGLYNPTVYMHAFQFLDHKLADYDLSADTLASLKANTVVANGEFTITATADEHGSISPSGTVTVKRDGSQPFTITPNSGYQIADVKVDGTSVGAVASYTFENVTANHTIEATFEKIPNKPTDPPYIPPIDPDEPADPDDTGVSDLLNTEDHIQYLFGYPDGTFGPENNMTRAEVAQMFYNLLLDQDVEITKTFDDVPANAWYAKAVNTLASLDIISGVGDNKFEPERSITRAEFTAMAMKFAVGGEEGENIFSDVDEDDWFYDAVVNSIQYGWIHGYGDGTFRPQNPITRAEVTAIVNNMLGRAADEDFVDEHAEELTPFSDIEKHWAYYHIVEATNDHDYTKPSSGENWTKLN